jgi:hypothetical protein
MQIAELTGNNAVPWEEVFPRFDLASAGSFHIWGVLKKDANSGKCALCGKITQCRVDMIKSYM